MAEIYFDVDAALSEVPVNIFPLTDDTNFKDREVSIAYNAAGMDLVWNFVTTAGAYTQTAVTPTTGGAYDWAHQGDGMYSIEIPASGGATINNDTEGFGWFTGFCTGVLPWRSPIFGFRAAGINNKLIDDAYDTARGLAGTALPAAAADAAGGLPISDAGGLDLDNKLAHTEEITAARMGALTDWINGGRLDLLLDAIKAITDQINFTGTYVDSQIKASDNIDFGVLQKASIGDSVLDELLSGHLTPGSTGITLTDTLGYVTALRTALTDLRAANLDKIVGTIATGTHNPQSGDAYGRIGVNGAGLTGLGDTRIAFLDASILSRSSHTAADVWAVTTRTLSSFGSLVVDIATAVWGAVVRTITGGTVDTCTTNTDMRGTNSALLAANYTAPNNSGITDIKAKTDQLTFTVANKVDATATVSTAGLATEANQTLIRSDIAALNDISVADILAGQTEAGLTLAHAMQIITALALKASGGGGATISFRNYGDTKNRLVMTVDDNGNRSAVTVSFD